MRVLVTGATGFLGRQVVSALRSQNHQVRCLVHTPGAETVFPRGKDEELDIHYGNVTDPPALRAAIYDIDAVVHLVAVIREKGNVTFDVINHLGTENVATASAQAGVKHFIHVSAIGAQDNPIYLYLQSKWRGEQAVVACGIPYTVIRASILFGPEDEFINRLAGLVCAFPVVPVAGPGTNQFQPLAAEDMARCITLAVGNEGLMGQVVEIGGPDHLSYNDIVQIIARTLGVKRAMLPLPLGLVQGLVRMMEGVLPSPPATREQLQMVVLSNIAELDSVPRHFGFQPRPLEGNIDFVKGITRWEGLRMTAGFTPARTGRG